MFDVHSFMNRVILSYGTDWCESSQCIIYDKPCI